MLTLKFYTRLSFLFLFFLVNNQLSYSQTTNKYQGLLWEISGNGLKKPSYLYGTMHVSNKVAFHLTDSFFIALKNVEMVALEINPENFLQEIMGTTSYILANSWNGQNGKDLYKRSFSANVPDNKTIGRILSREQNFANYLLYRSAREDNFEENTFLDLFIFQAGKKLNKQIYGLETLALTEELALQASVSDRDDDKPEVTFSRRDVTEQIEDAYRKGNLDLLDSLNRQLHSKKFTELMTYERNRLMAVKMDSILKKTSLFTGIGAAHLPGDNGVIELLRKKGYVLRPVVNVQKSNLKMKDKIEGSICKTYCSDQFLEDSLIKASIPGKLISYLEQVGNYNDNKTSFIKEYFYPEMSNGAYYTITRVNTFGPLHNTNQEYLLKRIDSLLFENIPGKIISKKLTNFYGNPGFDIINKTRKGDIQRYNIIITPIEIIIIKLRGTGNYVHEEGEKFFTSLKVSNKVNNTWNYYNSTAGFSIAMPGTMTVQNNAELNRGSIPEYLIQSVDPANNYYLFMKTNYNDFSYIEEDTFELNILAKNFYKELNYVPVNEKISQINGHPALTVKLKKDGKEDLHLRVMIIGSGYYLLGIKSTDEVIANKYFNTFSTREYIYTKPFEEYRDTSLFFSVKTPVKPLPENDYNRLAKYRSSAKKKDNSHLGYTKIRKFASPMTSEIIEVELIKYHEYKSFKTREEFWDRLIKNINNENSLIVKKSPGRNKDELDILLTDTNSTRAIKMKIIQKQGSVYTLVSNIDTIRSESPFVSTFFKSFQPFDTIIGKPIFENKGDKFFEALSKNENAKDSTKIAQALSSLAYIRFNDKHAPDFINIIKNYNLAKISKEPVSVKEDLIIELGHIKHKSIIPFLKELYLNSTDTIVYQLAVLKALAKQKSPEAYKTITDMLQADIPLANNNEIQNLFSEFKDSLKVSVHLYPNLLKFTRYQEYKKSIYELLAILVDSNYVNPMLYISSKQDIISDAKEEVKRRFSEKTTKRYSYNSYNSDYSYRNRKQNIAIRNKLEVYTILLIPYYEDPSVKPFFDKLNKIKDDELLLNTSIILLKNKKPVNDTVWKKLAKDHNYRISLYTKLKDINRLDKFDNTFLTQDYFVKGLLYQNSFDNDKDTIAFVQKRKVIVKGKEGYVYFYKRRSKENKIWQLDYTGIQPVDSTKNEVDFITLKKGIKFNTNELTKIMDKAVDEFTFYGRQRAGYRSRYNYSDYDYGYDYDDDYYDYED